MGQRRAEPPLASLPGHGQGYAGVRGVPVKSVERSARLRCVGATGVRAFAMTAEENGRLLADSSLFADLDDETLAVSWASGRCRQTFEKGRAIFYQGDEATLVRRRRGAREGLGVVGRRGGDGHGHASDAPMRSARSRRWTARAGRRRRRRWRPRCWFRSTGRRCSTPCIEYRRWLIPCCGRSATSRAGSPSRRATWCSSICRAGGEVPRASRGTGRPCGG